MSSDRLVQRWASDQIDDLDLLVPVSLIFLAFLPATWFLSNFDIGNSIDYLLVFGGLLLLSVAVKSAAELRFIYERHPRNRDIRVQPVTHRHFMYASHIFFAAVFLVLARFDWQFGSALFSIGLLIAAAVAIYLGLSAMYGTRDPARGKFYRRFDFGWIVAWSGFLLVHIVAHLNLSAAGEFVAQLGI